MQKITFTDRVSEYPGRRKFITTDTHTVAAVYDVERDEGAVSVQGTPYAAAIMNQMQDNIEAAIDLTAANFAEEYDDTLTYETGDCRMHAGVLYQANQDITTPEAWDATKWDAIKAVDVGGGGGSTVTPNPGTPTDTLETIGINGTNYDIRASEALKLVTTRHTTDIAPYLFRQSGGDNNAYVGTSEEDTLVGASAVVNQLVNIPSSDISKTQNGVTFTDNRDGSYSVITDNGGATSQTSLNVGSIKFELNHKYFGFGSPSNSTGDNFFIYTTTSFTANGRVVNENTGATRSVNIIVKNGVEISTAIKFKPQFIDLTAMFGTAIADYVYSLEQATAGSGIAYLRKYGFFTKDYIPYTANTLQSVNTSKHSMVGKNLFDKSTLTYGKFANSSGVISSNTAGCMSDYIKVIPNHNIQVRVLGNNSVGFYSYSVLKYDENKNFISRSHQYPSDSAMHSFTLPSDCKYIIFQIALSVGSTITEQNITDGEIMVSLALLDGDIAYEPFVKHEYTLPNIDLRGLYKLDASNNLYADGDTLDSDGTLTRKYEQRPYQSGDESLADAITDGTNTVVKLATPTTEQVTGFTNPQTVSKDGTEEYVDERDFPLPVGHETDYPKDYEMALPPPPEETGVYNFQVNVSSAGKTYGWAVENANRSVSLNKLAAPGETKTETEPDPEQETKAETKEAPDNESK